MGAPNVGPEDVVATYDRLAGAYDRFLAPFEAGTRGRALSLLSFEGGETVLEIGCGPGHALMAFARAVGPTGRVVWLDAAPGMIERARRRRLGSPEYDRIELTLGDANDLPIDDDGVDLVFVEDTLELFSPGEMERVLEEISRVLRPEGRLCVVTMERAGHETDPFVRAYDWVFDHVPGYDRVGCRPVYARRAIEAAGFVVEREARDRRGYVWPVEILVARPA